MNDGMASESKLLRPTPKTTPHFSKPSIFYLDLLQLITGWCKYPVLYSGRNTGLQIHKNYSDEDMLISCLDSSISTLLQSNIFEPTALHYETIYSTE